MLKSVFKIVIFGVVVAFVVASLAFSSRKLSGVKCTDLHVSIADDSPRFLSEEDIIQLITKYDDKLFNKKLSEINTEILEYQLMKETAIENVEIYSRVFGDNLSLKGKLLFEVEQRSPIIRIVSGTADYYLDKEGVRIPASKQFTAKVLLVNGSLTEKYAKEQLLPLAIFIYEDEFWNAQIEQIQVQPNGEIIIAPLVGNQLIEFGDASNFRKKLRNLKALYVQAFPKTGWTCYKKISLKYNNQVVCTKK